MYIRHGSGMWKRKQAAAAMILAAWAWLAPGWAAAQQTSAVRIEQSDASVGYIGVWSQDATKPWSGGTAAISASAGSRIEFSFTGTSVGWIGGRGSDTGIARVLIDGVLQAEIDTYSKTDETRVPMFAAHGLGNTKHKLTIEVTGRKRDAATAARIVVDAIDVPGVILSRLQETDPAVSFSAGWAQDNPVVTFLPGITTGRTQGESLRKWSAGAAALSSTPGASASFSFNGTAISWIGARGTQTGIARIYLDGQFVSEVDTYSPTEQIQASVFSAGGLADGDHLLTIETTGRKNPASESALIVVDGFDVTIPGRRFQETHRDINFSTGWIQDNRDKAYSEGSTAETVTPGAQATFTFSGSAVSWVTGRGPQTGIARVYLDRVLVDRIDLYSVTEAPQKIAFTARNLSPGTHTLTIEHTGEKNPMSSDTWVLVDAFDVRP